MINLIEAIVAAVGEGIDAEPVKALIEARKLEPITESGVTIWESESGITLLGEDQVVTEAMVSRIFEGEVAPGVTMSSEREQVRAAFGPPDETQDPDLVRMMGHPLRRAGWDRHFRGRIVVYWEYYAEGGLRAITISRRPS